MSRTEVQEPADAQLRQGLQRRRPVDGVRDLAGELHRCIVRGEDALAVTSGEQDSLASDRKAPAGVERVLQRFAGARKP